MPLISGPGQFAAGGTDLYQLMDTVGDGTGNFDANIDASGAPIEFKLSPAFGKTYHVFRLLIQIGDAGVFDTGKYGNNIVLTNGLRLTKCDANGELFAYTGQHVVFTNLDWGIHSHDLSYFNFGLGDNGITIRWSFWKTGSPIILDGNKGEYLAIVLNDNFTGLNNHHFTCQGRQF